MAKKPGKFVFNNWGALKTPIPRKMKLGYSHPPGNCLKFIGLKPARKSELFNGALLCSYRKYELFQGETRKLN